MISNTTPESAQIQNEVVTVSESVVKERVRAINQIGNQLKSEFSGIDKQIDTIIRYVTPFYATPELITRPVVVCLWGMTGVGKTHLLRRLAILMNMQSQYVTFDMGEYSGNFSEYTLRYQLDEVAGAVEDGRAMIVFDEMQTIRFIDSSGCEIDRPSARLIWDMLDGAPITRNTSFSNNSLDMLKEFERLRKLGVKIEKNLVVSGVAHFKRIRRKWSLDNNDDSFSAINLSDFENLYRSNPSYFNYVEDFDVWEKTLEQFSDISQYISCLREISEGSCLGEPTNLSRSLIFCVGNLDEVFRESHETNPDIDIEMLRSLTEKVTLSQVKNALLDRFRPEQIARLGNNHVIYPSLDRESYWKIIRKHVNHSLQRVKQVYNIDVHVDESVLDLIFKETVFPTQGARPVNTSFSAIFDAYLADALCQLTTEGDIYWLYEPDTRKYVFQRGEQTYYSIVQLMVESERGNVDTDKQAIVAVHEAGHGLAYALYTGQWPRELRSKTAGNAGGFMLMPESELKTRDDILNSVRYGMAGVIAEQIVYGIENVSEGAENDFSNLCNDLYHSIAHLGLFKERWIGYCNRGTGCMSDEESSQEISTSMKQILNTTREELVLELGRHRTLLLRIAEYLITHTVMSGEKFAEICVNHGVDVRKRFSHRESLLQSLAELKDVR